MVRMTLVLRAPVTADQGVLGNEIAADSESVHAGSWKRVEKCRNEK
jgi:hypothetical protein